jgi:hypothetical protein
MDDPRPETEPEDEAKLEFLRSPPKHRTPGFVKTGSAGLSVGTSHS